MVESMYLRSEARRMLLDEGAAYELRDRSGVAIESIGGGMPLEEMKEYEDFEDVNMEMMIGTVTRTQKRFFPKAGLGYVRRSRGRERRRAPFALLVARSATMMTRCLTILERRRKRASRFGRGIRRKHEFHISEAPTPVAAAQAPAPAKALRASALRLLQQMPHYINEPKNPPPMLELPSTRKGRTAQTVAV